MNRQDNLSAETIHDRDDHSAKVRVIDLGDATQMTQGFDFLGSYDSTTTDWYE